MAFAGDPEARLILKARFQVDDYRPDDARIQVVDRNEPTRGILHWYRQADLLLALGNEGFGLPLVEAMATGLPAVALDAEAQADVVAAGAAAGGLVLPVRASTWEKVDAPPFGPAGVRALPDVEDAARQLRWVAEHRVEAREMGRRASAWAHEQRNVWDMGPAVLEVMERHARTPRPLRRTYALWAPAGTGPTYEGGAAGPAYYAASLAKHLAQALVYAAPPRAGARVAWRSPLLHVHYAPGLVDDAELARQVQAARQAGMATLVTEHRLAGQARAWEQAADVLVALTAPAAARLRGRWPHKRIEVIPPGCPPWRPSPRPAGGRTVAVLGDAGAATEDLVEALLEALRALPGARLLVLLPVGARRRAAGEQMPR
ncbi:MAG: glycosyltransferase, partial [Anaerolineae bacterium]